MTRSDPIDVAIIGGGIAGATIAYHLPAAMRVAVFEAERQLGHHATGRSAAVWLPPYGSDVVRKLTSASSRFFQSPPAGFEAASLLSPRGFLCFAQPGEEGLLDEEFEAVRRDVSSVERVSPETAVSTVPILRPELVASAYFCPDAQDIDVNALHQGLIRLARAKGVQIVPDAQVTAIEKVSGGWRIDAGEVQVLARIVVNSAGAWGDTMARVAQVQPLALEPLRRSAALLPVPSSLAVGSWPMVADVAERFYFKPDAGKLLVSPADEVPADPGEAWVDDFDLAEGLDRFANATSFEVARVDTSWAGLRTFAADRNPVIGFDPDEAGFFWSVGQGGFGIQTSPAWGQIAAAMIAGLSPDIPRLGPGDLAKCDPRRFR
jgi:D-arginine dehydrogenase